MSLALNFPTSLPPIEVNFRFDKFFDASNMKIEW